MSVIAPRYAGSVSYVRSQGGIIDQDEDAVVQKLNVFTRYIAG